MDQQVFQQAKLATSATPGLNGILQRACACGQHTSGGGECAECRKTREGTLQRAAVNAAPVNEVPPIVHDVLRSSGQPLDAETRAFMEPRFGHDFSGVRIHTDAQAGESARTVNALAYTVGRDVVFGAGQLAPGTTAGNRLLAHELAHVVQQGNRSRLQTKLTIGPVNDHYEQEADRVTEQVMRGGDGAEPVLAATPHLQRTIGDGHDLNATRFSGNAVLEAAYDNERVIRMRHTGTAVRLIQESLLAQGYNLPLFGADGIFGDETEAAVRQFQIDAGAELLDGIVGPETMGLLDVHDPGTTAPTGPGAPPAGAPAPPAATAVFFQESADQEFAGYDDSVTPNWLVVPVDGRRQAETHVNPAGARPTFVSLDPTIASVETMPNGMVVTGEADGHTTIEASEGGIVLDQLQIEVKSRRDITVDYHFMSDTPAPPLLPHTTTRAVGDAPEMTARLNRIWERQANVRFRTGVVDPPQVGVDLGGQVLWAAGPANEWNTVTAFATGGNWNVFLVWEYEQDVTPLVDNANAGTLGSNTLLEDNECPDALTIAHEAGHFLGRAGHAASGIMTGCPGVDRRQVPKADADTVNP
jgi:peptidoglycan hydrolase-like protein with peptidoglycan-binding domain